MTFKKVAITAIATIVLGAFIHTSPSAAADSNVGGVLGGKLSATVGAVSDYTFRGITQNDEHPALQGSIDYTHPTGFYAGVWGSNVDFKDASIETDVYAGYKFSFNGIDYDIGGIGYLYPAANNSTNHYNYFEAKFAASKNFGLFTGTGSLNYSPDYFASSGDALYANLGLSAPIMNTGITFSAAIGRQWVNDNAAFGVPDYFDYSAGLAYNWNGIDFGLKYNNTSLSKSECADGCEGRIIFSVGKTF